MNLAIDIGNTWVKVAVIEDRQVVDTFRSEEITPDYLEWTVFGVYPHIRNGILVSTRGDHPEIREYLENKLSTFTYFTHDTPVPIENLYGTPETLGLDRLAASVGANAAYPEDNVLIFDLGTAITIDFVTDKGEYKGGNISPGAGVRFRALNQFTSRLPLRALPEEPGFMGASSADAIENGVANGIIYEIEGYINRFSKEFSNLRIIFTGGDGDYFARRINHPVFVTSNLVVYGLNKILEYNV